jgi:hypothetical protein
MDFHSIFTDMQPDLLLLDLDADNETLYGTGVYMGDHTTVVFFAAVQKGEAATYTLKAQQDTVSNFASTADLAGTAKAIAIATNTNGFGFIEIKNPQEPWVRPALVCPNVGAAKGVAIFAIRYGNRYLPETNSDGELHVAPAEGTA